MRAAALQSISNRLRDLKIAQKLMLAFGLVLILGTIQGVSSYRGLASLGSAADQITDSMRSVKNATMLRALVGDYRTQEYRLLMKASEAVKVEARESIESLALEIADLEEALKKTAASEEERTQIELLMANWSEFRAVSQTVIELIDLELEDDAIDTHLGEAHDKYLTVVGQLDTLVDMNSGSADLAAAGAAKAHSSASSLIVLMLLASIAASLALAWLVARVMSRSVNEAVRVAREIASGTLDGHITVGARDEVGELMSAMQTMQHDLRERIENDRRIASENLRIRNALDRSSTPVLITDNDRQIIYANDAVFEILLAQQEALRTSIPALDIEHLVGTSIDLFSTDPQALAASLESLHGVQRSQAMIGKAHIAQSLSPVLDAEGNRLGFVLEWRDRTAQVRVEGEVAEVIDAASLGDLSKRLPLEGKTGFFKDLAEGINQMLDTNQASIGEVQRVLAALARGDLTQKIDADFQGVFGQMKDDANATVDQLTAIVGGIKETTDAINVAAREISSGNADLSSRTEQQAASLEETASSMEELTSTVQQNADNARQANKLAIGASQVAVKGGDVVGNVVTTMDAIHASSKKIFDIISVIDGIAFQTNILALNAAVEAARAGEQGRGFAVVAAEVRSLAQRSAEAAKEIKGLIGDSVAKVADGTKLVDEAGRTMNEIVESVKRVTGIMADIAAASDEQSAGIQQVSQTVTHMDEVTQQNAALVEEATAAARSLEEQAEGLARAVAAFKLSDDHTHALDMQRQADIMVATPARPKAAPAARPMPAAAPAPNGNGKARGRIEQEDQNWQEF